MHLILRLRSLQPRPDQFVRNVGQAMHERRALDDGTTLMAFSM